MTTPMPDDLRARADAWMAGDVDERTRTAMRALLDGDDLALLTDHVGAALSFGTAGLRGEVGPGPNRMNRSVVIRTTRGLADFLLAEVPDAATRGVIVGFDARTDSERFAVDTVGVLAAAGIEVRWFPTPQPTPLIAYAQKVLDAAAAVVVTASHNPPADNGYKVYVEGAAQIVSPTDAAIAAAIEAVGPANEVPLVPAEDLAGCEQVAPVDAAVVERFLQELEGARPPLPDDVPRDLRIVYTPLHGVAGELIRRAFALAGFEHLHVVPSQAEPDGTFPTVSFPNPEEPGALDASLELARRARRRPRHRQRPRRGPAGGGGPRRGRGLAAPVGQPDRGAARQLPPRPLRCGPPPRGALDRVDADVRRGLRGPRCSVRSDPDRVQVDRSRRSRPRGQRPTDLRVRLRGGPRILGRSRRPRQGRDRGGGRVRRDGRAPARRWAHGPRPHPGAVLAARRLDQPPGQRRAPRSRRTARDRRRHGGPQRSHARPARWRPRDRASPTTASVPTSVPRGWTRPTSSSCRSRAAAAP